MKRVQGWPQSCCPINLIRDVLTYAYSRLRLAVFRQSLLTSSTHAGQAFGRRGSTSVQLPNVAAGLKPGEDPLPWSDEQHCQETEPRIGDDANQPSFIFNVPRFDYETMGRKLVKYTEDSSCPLFSNGSNNPACHCGVFASIIPIG